MKMGRKRKKKNMPAGVAETYRGPELKRVPFNMRMDSELLDELKEISKLSGLTMTELIEGGAKKWLASPELNAELDRRAEQLRQRKKQPDYSPRDWRETL